MTRTISIIFNDDHIEGLNFAIDKIPLQNITTKWLRRNIRSLRSQTCQFKSLRFLRNGNLLVPSKLNDQLVKYWKLSENGNNQNNSDNNVNLINQDIPNNISTINNNANDLNSGEIVEPFYIHCNIGIEDIKDLHDLEQIDQDFDNNAELNNGNNNLENNDMGAIGFDRLRNLGFSDEEIELLRQQFQNTYGHRLNNNNNNNNNTDIDDEIDIGNNNNNDNNINTDVRQLEEQWMENDVNDETFNSIPITNLENNKDLLIGISIGFTLGLFSFLLLRLDGLFNNRQKMSMYAGIFINIIFCLFTIF